MFLTMTALHCVLFVIVFVTRSQSDRNQSSQLIFDTHIIGQLSFIYPTVSADAKTYV